MSQFFKKIFQYILASCWYLIQNFSYSYCLLALSYNDQYHDGMTNIKHWLQVPWMTWNLIVYRDCTSIDLDTTHLFESHLSLMHWFNNLIDCTNFVQNWIVQNTLVLNCTVVFSAVVWTLLQCVNSNQCTMFVLSGDRSTVKCELQPTDNYSH